MRTWMFVVVLTALAGGRAYAYPQFQLSRDATCTGCHISPDGGGLLNENGTGIAEQLAWKPGNSAFLNGLVPTPDWLQLGGDLRGAAGFVYPDTPNGAGYPMQIDFSGRAQSHGFSANVIVGFREPNDLGGSPLHVVWPREHYLMWQLHPDENYGLYIRVGHLLPTYGLRLAEHVAYTEDFGGKPLFGEAYGIAASWVSPAFEVHATGFVHDPYGEPAEKGDGAAITAEARMGAHAAIGTSGKLSKGPEEEARYESLFGKLYLEGADVVLLAEGELIQRHITAGAGDRVNQIAGYVMAARPLPDNLELDVGLGHFTEDTRVKGLIRDCIDANIKWYATSHAELLFTTRFELLDGTNGPKGGYALVQAHWRL